ncbi:hypothetical protein Phum_PHUM380190 [Pediculus humanus corporis]|uniref:Uncharacterized protein n=1 Tax=Pediculus humanus subsp. corporis TaxID=121224 RepID=E0VQM8_PEDHC|nr:uncharacterized protein Phum_PHUM380190 [Pediculus humanus corporis]EEB15684.1 hypothetical protein Phum_PHUM380190 [Pediculus humanus corporis]
MLVPNPSQDFRAMVGGVDADNLSDISDLSDTILENLNSKNFNLIVNDFEKPKKNSTETKDGNESKLTVEKINDDNYVRDIDDNVKIKNDKENYKDKKVKNSGNTENILRKEYVMPKVKELVKQFAPEEFVKDSGINCDDGEKLTEGKMEKKKNGIPVIIPYNGKEIHSLTARSISKVFREGLKNNTTTVKLFQKNVDVDGENTQYRRNTKL